jgi:hypothetical protein
LLFEKKVKEFLIRSEKIKKQYTGKKMLDRLYVNRQQEIAEMGDIKNKADYSAPS